MGGKAGEKKDKSLTTCDVDLSKGFGKGGLGQGVTVAEKNFFHSQRNKESSD